MPEDWRIVIELDSNENAEDFRAACAAVLPPTADSSRVRSAVYVYPDTEEEALRAWDSALDVAERDDFGIDLRLERWNPATRDWQAPDRPVPPEPPRPLGIELTKARWQVRIKTATREQADRLEEELWARGYGTARLGRRHLVLAAEREVDANVRALAAQRFAATGAVEIRPLGWFGRGWLDLRLRGLAGVDVGSGLGDGA